MVRGVRGEGGGSKGVSEGLGGDEGGCGGVRGVVWGLYEGFGGVTGGIVGTGCGEEVSGIKFECGFGGSGVVWWGVGVSGEAAGILGFTAGGGCGCGRVCMD